MHEADFFEYNFWQIKAYVPGKLINTTKIIKVQPIDFLFLKSREKEKCGVLFLQFSFV